jgi:amidase
LLKDNVVTLDRMETTSGSLALVGARPNHEASVVTKLRKAGVVLLGKTNHYEWSNFRSEKSSSGWSPRGGQTYGAYLKNSQPSGSSSGSAVSVALGLAWAALGTEVSSTAARVLLSSVLMARVLLDNW